MARADMTQPASERPTTPPTDAPAAAPTTMPPTSGVAATHGEARPCAICAGFGHTAFAHLGRHTVRVVRVQQ
jgi:hypothetical protein